MIDGLITRFDLWPDSGTRRFKKWKIYMGSWYYYQKKKHVRFIQNSFQ